MKEKEVKKLGSQSSKKGIYNKYSFDTRKKLISMVEEQNRTLASSAKELGICHTSARLIISTWRAERRVFEKKSDQEKRMKRQAKRHAKAQRKIKILSQRPEIKKDASREKGPNMTTSQTPAEFELNIRNRRIQDDIAQPQLTEYSRIFHQHLLQQSISYELLECQCLYYLQMPFNLPTHFGWY